MNRKGSVQGSGVREPQSEEETVEQKVARLWLLLRSCLIWAAMSRVRGRALGLLCAIMEKKNCISKTTRLYGNKDLASWGSYFAFLAGGFFCIASVLRVCWRMVANGDAANDSFLMMAGRRVDSAVLAIGSMNRSEQAMMGLQKKEGTHRTRWRFFAVSFSLPLPPVLPLPEVAVPACSYSSASAPSASTSNASASSDISKAGSIEGKTASTSCSVVTRLFCGRAARRSRRL